ncbi:FHA domain-containing protein [Promicromonospora sukumoe]|uniref:FHA domain-containing protein n=1 Tax=Promicromonospora sukumoe TaxID=88382 RepID=UPI0003729399|nr:FHA domain-containing protein [Promicromonospora sukumoe]
MTVVCPEGHTSQATDYCDVCGTPIPASSAADPGRPGSAASAAPAAGGGSSTPAEAASGPVTCPNCGDVSPGDSLFCENCGYDFTTGTPAAPAPPAAPASGLDLGDLGATQPGTGSVPADPGSGQVAAGSAPASAGSVPASAGPAGMSASAGVPAPAPSSEGGLAAPPVPGDDVWVAEIWVDPDWYAHERPEDPMPSAGLPGLVTLRQRSLLVGRPSRSRGITPDIDCGSDPGVSRRHCQLTTDGQRWWVEDLGSSNGTFVSAAGDPLPDNPLTQGVRREIEENDRVFVGAWTRLVIRKALPGEA